MKRVIFLIGIVLSFGNSVFAQNTIRTDFQVYAIALYLIQSQPVEIKDSVNFLLDEKWIKTVDTYLKDLDTFKNNKQNDYPNNYQNHHQKIYLPEIENLGITLEFHSKIHAKEWLKTPAARKFIKKTNSEISYKTPRWTYNKPDSSCITLTSTRYINWLVGIHWLQTNYNLDLYQYGYFSSARIIENALWDYYNPKPCADKCADFTFCVDYTNTDNIIFGHHSSGSYTGFRNVGWTWNYSISKRTIQEVITKNPWEED